MNRAISFIFCTLTAVTLSAAIRTPEEAAVIAAKYLTASNAPSRDGSSASAAKQVSLAMTQAKPGSDEAALYVFNTEGGDGFAIISADDRMQDLLAYSDNGHIDTGNIPANMQWWMDATSAAMTNHATNAAALPSGYKVIMPLLDDIEWNQFEPYNLLCPEIEGEHAVTGCVATAAAQVMRYWKWPLHGNGSSSYEWEGQTLSANYSGTYYDWDNMPGQSDEYISEQQCNAVSTLMYQVGVALCMGYGTSATGGSSASTRDIASALPTYFGYVARYHETSEGRLNIVYQDLQAGRPVIMSGANSNGNNGHAFVCDGTDIRGFLHINWGWGGAFNGYFAYGHLTVQGDDFNYRTELITGIKPKTGEVYDLSGFYITPSEARIKIGQKTILSTRFVPTYASQVQRQLKWTSSNQLVAMVDDGEVTGISAGTAVITATAENGLSATATITVTDRYYHKPTFKQISDISELTNNDKVLIVSNDNGVAMGLFEGGNAIASHISTVPVKIKDGIIELEDTSTAAVMTLHSYEDVYYFETENGDILGANGAQKLGWDKKYLEWTMETDESHNVLMQAAGYNSSTPLYLGYNVSAGYFTFNKKADVALPQIYHLYEDPANKDYTIRNLKTKSDNFIVTFSWEADDKAPAYQFQILSDDMILGDWAISDMAVRVNMIGIPEFTWRVRAIDGEGNPLTDFADGEHVIFECYNYDLGLEIVPIDDNKFQIKWKDTEDIAYADIELYSYTSESSDYEIYNHVTSPFTLDLPNIGTYLVIISAFDNMGRIVAYKESDSFQVTVPYYAVKDLKASVNGYHLSASWNSKAPFFSVNIYDYYWSGLLYSCLADSTGLEMDWNQDGLFHLSVVPLNENKEEMDGSMNIIFSTNDEVGMTGIAVPQKPVKQLRNGRIVIIRNGKTYNTSGMEE